MTDVVVELLTAIVGLGTAMLGIFNEYKNRKKKRNKEEEYYRLVLYPFIIKYRENKEMDAREFLEKNSAIKKNQDVIPTYIYYLLNENDENNENHKKLTKVLWCDYCDLYVNDTNKMIGILKGFKKILMYAGLIGAIVAVSLYGVEIAHAAEFLLHKVLELLAFNWTELLKGWNDFLKIIYKIVAYLASGLVFIWYVNTFDDDMYTLDKKKIQKMINKKEKRYTKREKEFVV